jgi:hypothetical protein
MFRSKKRKPRSYSTDPGTGLFAWAGNLALFYLILLALVTIPFLILLVILSIRTALDYQVWILTGILILLAVTVFLVIQRRKQIQKRFENEKKDVMEVIRTAAREGHNVNISFLHGLFRLDYQSNNNDTRLIEGPEVNRSKALPMSIHTDDSNQVVMIAPQDKSEIEPVSIAMELERLSGLLDRGVLTEVEFRELKDRLLKER